MAALFAFAAAAEVPDAARAAQIVVLGEQHDNPDHHARQARWVQDIAPSALVFEMLTAEQAAQAVGVDRMDAAALDAALGWTGSGWPDFAMYHPIFTAAPGARVFGAAVPRAEIMPALEATLAAHPLAARFGFDQPADPEEQALREAGQARAHCDALPEEMLPIMVDAQRLRDMVLAQTALDALAETGGPVAVITGNGHARQDWGVPALIAFAAPETSVFTLLQAEDGGRAPGGADLMLSAPAPARGDPCAAFAD